MKNESPPSTGRRTYRGWSPYAGELLRELPPLTRTRGYRLYDNGGRRYLDLYQDGGRGILGHRPSGMATALKDALGKGGLAPYPSILEKRLSRHLAELLPGYTCFRLYASFERLLEAISLSIGTGLDESTGVSGGADTLVVSPLRLTDPALPRDTADCAADFSDGVEVPLWRPFLSAGSSVVQLPGIIVPVLPFPGSMAPWVAAFRKDPVASVPASDTISPAAVAAMSRAVCDMISSVRSTPRDPWTGVELPGWSRRGPYLTAECPAEAYRRRFRRYLDAGVLLNPRFPGPSILPREWSDGERALVKKLAQEDADADT